MKRTPEELCARMKQGVLFRFLEEGDVAAFPEFLGCRNLSAGEILWKEGDPCDYLAFIVEGRLEMKKSTEFAGKEVVIGVYSAGTIAGEICILNGTPRAVTAVALENSSLLVLSKEDFERLLREHPESGVRLLKGMLLAISTRLRKSFERLAAVF
jgi:CRP/FNR family cyclic AMP-dependent transcriptional regulator